MEAEEERRLHDEQQRAEIWTIVVKEYPWVLQVTPAHPIVRDDKGVLRWEADPLLAKLIQKGKRGNDEKPPALNMNMVPFALSKEEQRCLARRVGYSLSGYRELSYVREWFAELENNNNKKE